MNVLQQQYERTCMENRDLLTKLAAETKRADEAERTVNKYAYDRDKARSERDEAEAQRDKVAGLLREIRNLSIAGKTLEFAWPGLARRIDGALAEIEGE